MGCTWAFISISFWLIEWADLAQHWIWLIWKTNCYFSIIDVLWFCIIGVVELLRCAFFTIYMYLVCIMYYMRLIGQQVATRGQQLLTKRTCIFAACHLNLNQFLIYTLYNGFVSQLLDFFDSLFSWHPGNT